MVTNIYDCEQIVCKEHDMDKFMEPMCEMFPNALKRMVWSCDANAAAAAAAAHDIAISCGSTGNYVSPDGRKWVGDVGSQFLFPRRTKITKSCSSSSSSNSFNYLTTTARISTTDFSYTIPVNAGQKFIRLHFSPAPYPGFDSSKCIFTVKAGPYTLLRNFSLDAAAAAAAAETPLITKEFCLNFDQQQQALTITFSPSVAASSSASSYAIINGIEIVSVPTGLYHTPDGDDDYQGGGTLVVGQKHHHRFLIDNTTALELIQRVNIGGSTISPTDDGSTLRVWSGDIDYWLEPGISPIITANNITFMNKPPASSSSSSSSYVVVVAAPHRLYQTARFVNHDMLNLTRKVMVDVGFRYLIRLHFCELDEAVRGRGQRQFNIYVNDRIAESKADLFEWTGGSSNLALHRDYVMTMHGDTRRDEGKRKLVVALEPVQTEQVAAAGAILNGLEIFKLSNPDNNLAGHHNSHQPPPLHPTMRISSSKPPPMSLLLLLLYNRGASVSGLIVLMTLLNIVFYKLRLQVDKSGSNTSSSSSSSSAKSYRRFSLEEMVVAANNFDEALVIGEGGFGRVYKGVINEKGAIKVAAAIKRLKKSVIMSKQGADEFWTEIETLSKIPRHPHLVNLIGYCDEGDEKILVYEYAVNGTLADHLHSKCSSRTRSAADCLSWERRLNICIGAARGLEYLHNGAPHRIIHRDVKASNILLADNWVPKISDFGFSKAASSTSNSNSNETTPEIMGTFGYLDMDYFLTQRLTRKSDVYAFGVLLFEVLCGRPAIDTSFEGEERSLALWAQRCIKEGKLDQIIDPSLTKVTPHSLKAFAEVAFKCLHNRPNARPRMPDVLQRLEFALLLTSQNQHAAGACPSSTDTELEQEEEEEEEEEEDEDYDALLERRSSSSATIIIDNMHTDPITEEEGDDACSTGSSPVSPSLQDGGIMTRAKSQKKTYSKVLDGIAKSMDLRRRKPVPVPKITEAKNSINNSFSSSGGGRTAWWKQRTRSFGIQPRLSSSSLPERPCRHFSLGEMRAATNNFHRNMIIKYGGPGTGAEMYRGYIDNGYLQVAIERLATANNKSKFLQEVELLLLRSQQLYHHRNLVPFIGYCKDEDENEMLLVYQYMARGDLSNHLYGCGTGGNEPVVLPWKKRLEICVGAAQGLDYLHNSNHLENPIIHGDIKSSSILLDEKWVPKISGLKFPGGGEVKSGTPPRPITTSNNYNVLHELPKTKESDVYSFGVVLLEVFCGREALIPHLKYRDQRNLVHWFKSCMQKKEMDRIIDDNLIGKIAPKCLRVFVRTVEWCLQFRAVDRPSMDVVLRRLQDALLLQQGAGEDHHRYTY
ncbi:receptor-like protein kinase FERONIA [Impatiens glandulifera]|uniref:receptor-like protein kinase FERONIA n=1 Tax=Impatiens glandulifera TaxID=253017 RepID=UPI001FB129A6|nr:receptor-like protein kinase FERONIA [Impatiens glandulifera]